MDSLNIMYPIVGCVVEQQRALKSAKKKRYGKLSVDTGAGSSRSAAPVGYGKMESGIQFGCDPESKSEKCTGEGVQFREEWR